MTTYRFIACGAVSAMLCSNAATAAKPKAPAQAVLVPSARIQLPSVDAGSSAKPILSVDLKLTRAAEQQMVKLFAACRFGSHVLIEMEAVDERGAIGLGLDELKVGETKTISSPLFEDTVQGAIASECEVAVGLLTSEATPYDTWSTAARFCFRGARLDPVRCSGTPMLSLDAMKSLQR